MCDTSLFHLCTDLGLGEVVIESSKSIFLYFLYLYISCLLIFIKLHSPRLFSPSHLEIYTFSLVFDPFSHFTCPFENRCSKLKCSVSEGSKIWGLCTHAGSLVNRFAVQAWSAAQPTSSTWGTFTIQWEHTVTGSPSHLGPEPEHWELMPSGSTDVVPKAKSYLFGGQWIICIGKVQCIAERSTGSV